MKNYYNKNFEIIKNSESYANYDEPDKEYKGVIPGKTAGFNFEVRHINDGHIDYMSCVFIDNETPTDYIRNLFYDFFETISFSGFEPTGRVIFRGYGETYYDHNFHDWCVIMDDEK